MPWAGRSLPPKRTAASSSSGLLPTALRLLAEALKAANPDLGDIAIFGVLYSVRGLNAHDYAIEQRGGAVKEWYDRMSKQILPESVESI